MVDKVVKVLGAGVVVLLLCISFSKVCMSGSITEKHVLIFHGYTQDFPANALFDKGLKEEFEKHSQYHFSYSYEYLDMRRLTKDVQYFKDTAQYFARKYSAYRPDVIVSKQEPSIFLKEFCKGIFSDVPVVCAWDADRMPGYALPPEFGVVRMTNDIDKNVKLILDTRPSTKKIVVVVGNSKAETRYFDTLKVLKSRYSGVVAFEYLQKVTYEGMLSQVQSIDDDSAILYLRWTVDVDGARFIPAEVIKDICKVASVPVYTISDHIVGSGVLGGYVLSHEIVGKNVARFYVDSLAGRSISEILSQQQNQNLYVFDWRALKRWNIKESSLPQDSRVEFKVLSIWQLYGMYIAIGVLLFLAETALIVGLLVNRRRRIHFESQLLQMTANLEGLVCERTNELQSANQELSFVAEKLQEVNLQLDAHSRTDALTGLYNRRHMDEIIHDEHIKYGANGRSYSVVLIDVDHFKRINDSLGHGAKDYMLKLLSEHMQDIVRPSDTLARWGGEEFLLLLPEQNINGALAMAERLRKAVAESKFEYEGEMLHVTLTLGVATVNNNDTVNDVFKRADTALYDGKRTGRNKVVAC